MKKLQLSLIGLLTVFCGYVFYISFYFNMQFIDKRGNIMFIDKYRAEGGDIHLVALLVLIILISILYLLYAYLDSKRVEIFDDGRSVEFLKKNNMFEAKRVIVYIVLLLAILTSIDSVLRVFTYYPDTNYTEIFYRDFMIGSMDFVMVYLLLVIGSMVYEYKVDKDKIYVS